jgi:hypothetical protein
MNMAGRNDENNLAWINEQPSAPVVRLHKMLVSLKREGQCDKNQAARVLSQMYEIWPCLVPARLRFPGGAASNAIRVMILEEPGTTTARINARIDRRLATRKSIHEMVSRMVSKGEIRRDGRSLYLTAEGGAALGNSEAGIMHRAEAI